MPLWFGLEFPGLTVMLSTFCGLYAINKPSLVKHLFRYSPHYLWAVSFLIEFIYLFIVIVVLGGGTLWCLQKFSHSIKYIILEFTLSTILLYPPFPHCWNISASIISAFTYIHTHFFAPYSPFYPLSLPPPSSHWYQLLPWAGSVPPSCSPIL
jgi:hypothetical protein